jgi:hypothetical protein
MFALVTKVTGTAGNTNTNTGAIQQLKSAINAGAESQESLKKEFAGMKQFLEHAVVKIEASYRELEQNCVTAVSHLAKESKEGLED